MSRARPIFDSESLVRRGFSRRGKARPRPPLPPLPERGLLFHAGFDTLQWWEFAAERPLWLRGVETVESWSGYAVTLAGKEPALLRFPLVDAKGNVRLTPDVGSLRLWFRPAWSSAPLGGGPGAFGRLLELGAWTPDAALGWWALGVSADGASLVFAAQARGQTVEYLRAPIQWQAGEWHQVALTYSAQGSAPYLDGHLAALGAGVTHWPEAAAVLAEGFAVGSDGGGLNLAQGQFEELATFAQPLTADEVAWNHRIHAANARRGPITAEEDAAWLLQRQAAAASGQGLDSLPRAAAPTSRWPPSDRPMATWNCAFSARSRAPFTTCCAPPTWACVTMGRTSSGTPCAKSRRRRPTGFSATCQAGSVSTGWSACWTPRPFRPRRST